MSTKVFIDPFTNTEIVVTQPDVQMVGEKLKESDNNSSKASSKLEFNDKILFENIKHIKDSLSETLLAVDFKDFIRYLDLHIEQVSEERESLLKEVSELREKVGGLLLESSGNEKKTNDV